MCSLLDLKSEEFFSIWRQSRFIHGLTINAMKRQCLWLDAWENSGCHFMSSASFVLLSSVQQILIKASLTMACAACSRRCKVQCSKEGFMFPILLSCNSCELFGDSDAMNSRLWQVLAAFYGPGNVLCILCGSSVQPSSIPGGGHHQCSH